MKKTLAIILALCLGASMLAACGGSGPALRLPRPWPEAQAPPPPKQSLLKSAS